MRSAYSIESTACRSSISSPSLLKWRRDALISRSRLPRLRFSAEQRKKNLPGRPRGNLWTTRFCPIIEQHNREGKFPAQLVPIMADLGFFGAPPERLWLRGNVECRIWPGDAGNRAGGFCDSQLRFGAIGPRDVSHSHLRLNRAEGKVASADAAGQGYRLLRTDRASIRLQPRRHAYPRHQSKALVMC